MHSSGSPVRTSWFALARRLALSWRRKVESITKPDNENHAMSDQSSQSIDIGKQQIGGVYAKALLGAANQDGSADAVVTEFGELMTTVMETQPTFRRVL